MLFKPFLAMLYKDQRCDTAASTYSACIPQQCRIPTCADTGKGAHKVTPMVTPGATDGGGAEGPLDSRERFSATSICRRDTSSVRALISSALDSPAGAAAGGAANVRGVVSVSVGFAAVNELRPSMGVIVGRPPMPAIGAIGVIGVIGAMPLMPPVAPMPLMPPVAPMPLMPPAAPMPVMPPAVLMPLMPPIAPMPPMPLMPLMPLMPPNVPMPPMPVIGAIGVMPAIGVIGVIGVIGAIGAIPPMPVIGIIGSMPEGTIGMAVPAPACIQHTC
eukprot:352861-Chlamydomonas_euryale.AAC.7